MYKGNELLNGNNELVDSIKASTGSQVTLFADDTRVATTIEEANEKVVGTTASQEVVDRVLTNDETFIGEANVVGENYNTIYTSINNASGEAIGMFFIGIPTSFQESLIADFIVKLLIFMGVLMTIAFIATYFMGQSLARPIVRLNKVALNFSKLDVREEIADDLLERKDEVGGLSNSFNTLRFSLKEFIEKIAEASNQVSDASGNMSASAEELYAAAEDMAQTMQDISSGSEQQATETSKASGNVHELAEGITKVVDTSNALDDITRLTEDLKNNGLNIISDLMNRTKDSSHSMNHVEEMLLETQKSAQEITEVVNMINAISEKTNLLSLNASIEAARAGEHGKGFAVVAEEIRALSEQSSSSTLKVEEIIKEVQNKVSNTVDVLSEMSDTLQFQENVAYDTDEIFQKLASNLEYIKMESAKMAGLGDDMITKKDYIVEVINHISRLSETNASSTHEAAATTEEQTAASSEVANGSKFLAQLATNLKSMVQVFKV